MKKIQVTHIKDTFPTSSNNIANGYNVGQWWEDTTTGNKFFHKTDGQWIMLQSGTIGKIKIVDLEFSKFNDLGTAHAYVQQFTNATITDESYSDGVYYFTVPKLTSFALASQFLMSFNGDFIDEFGLITEFGSEAFSTNIGNNIFGDVTFGNYSFFNSMGNNSFGNCTFGDYSFYGALGNNTFGNCTFGDEAFTSSQGINKFQSILLSVSSNKFAGLSAGRFEIYGNIGTTEGNDYTEFFPLTTAVIWAQKVKETSNAGEIEGDLAFAEFNGAKLDFGYNKPIPTKTSDLINDGDNGTSHFISLEDLPANIVLYPTSAASDISGYSKMVTSITDPSYDVTAVDISTGSITTSNQLIASLATSANIIIGNPGIFNITTIGNIQKTAGSGTAEFYFEVYKRNAAGIETLITTSNTTQEITSSAYEEFSASALWNDGLFISTDRIVIKYYGTKVGGGSNPRYNFQFGGTSPVRTLLPIPLSVVPSDVAVEDLSNMSDVSYTGVTDSDSLLIKDNANSLWKRLTWSNLKSNLKTYFDTLYAPKSSLTRIIISDTTESSPVFGTAFAEVIVKTYTIPPNSFSPTDFMKFYLSVEKDLQNGGVVVEVKMSNSSTFIPGTFASSRVLRSVTQGVYTATIKFMGISRIFNKFNGTGSLNVPAITTPTDQAGSVTTQGQLVTLDPTQTIYVWVTLTNFSALDTSKVTSFLLTN